jgi:hypothetical protein
MSYTIENKDIVISGWEEGILDNPYSGIYDMRNCDAVTIPGEVSVALGTQVMTTQGAITTVTFTCDHTTDVFTYDGVIPLAINTAIIFAGSDLPNGLTKDTTAYYILTTPTPTTFTISESIGGAQKLVSDNGTGVMTFSTINIDTPKYFTETVIPVNAGTRIYFCLDASGRAWTTFNINQSAQPISWVYMNNLPSEAATNIGNGMVAWSNYLFVFDATTIYAMPLYVGSFSYSYVSTKANWINWKTIQASTYSTISHYAMVSINDNSVYFCNENYIGYFALNTSALTNPLQSPFNTSTGRVVADGVANSTTTITSATMAFTNKDVGAIIVSAGTIPAGTYIASVTNSTTAILSQAATASGSGYTFTIYTTYAYNENILPLPNNDQANCLGELGSNLMIGGVDNYIYPWDRVSKNFNTPIFLSETVISRLVTINTTMYIFCGFKGRIFVTNGANATPFYKMPEYLANTTNSYIIWTDAAFNRNQLYFGFKVTKNDGTAIETMGGLWAIDVDAAVPVAPRYQNQLSYGTYAGYVGAIHIYRKFGYQTLPANDGYGLFIGWNNGSTLNGIDKGISTPYLGSQSYIDCDPLPLGSFLIKKTLESVEFKLAVPLVAGELVELYYRLNINDNYVIMPITQGGQTGDISGIAYNNFQDAQWIQIRVVLTSTATNPSFVRLREIRLK